MEKVWFKLSQTHYPPGPENAILAGEGDDTNCPIALGHCITDLKRLDFPINHSKITKFPPRMQVYQHTTTNFTWNTARKATRLGIGAAAPLLLATGMLTIKASVQHAFERSVSEHEKYARLDTYFMQPNPDYINNCLKTPALKEYADRMLNRSFFMITGICVARAGSRFAGETSQKLVQGGPKVDVSTFATTELTGKFGGDIAQSVEQGKVSDFIWAVRLAKVHKGLLATDWSIDPHTRGATFGVDSDGQEVDVAAVVTSNGRQNFIVVEDEELNEAIVIDVSDWEGLEEQN